MREDLYFKKVLIFGSSSFTTKYLEDVFLQNGLKVAKSIVDITDIELIKSELLEYKPDYIINLAAISYVAFSQKELFYKVNTIGAINILDAVLECKIDVEKILLISSASVYGNSYEVLSEDLCPNPINHYGNSKLAMENMAKSYFDRLNIVIARTFNYTGIGQGDNFLIPKIVKHFKEKRDVIELGNIDVYREFNDANYVSNIYFKLLTSDVKSQIVNVSSNRVYCIDDIIKIMEEISKHSIKIKINPKFIRKNEIKKLSGDTKKLFTLIGEIEPKPIKNILKQMYEA